MREMFKDISDRYDLMNTLMTFGRDRAWRRYIARMTGLGTGQILLDIGTGTGKIPAEALGIYPGIKAVALDLTPEMMRAGRIRISSDNIFWCCGDALKLPFKDETFDAVSSGYLIRNTVDITQAFKEQLRVLRPGGRVVCLDTCPAKKGILKPFILAHMKIVIPVLGRFITGSKNAYRYLPESTQAFKTPEELAAIMNDTGFINVIHRRFMFGTIGVVIGMRPRR